MSCLGLPGWFRHAYFEYRAHVRLRFKLASGLGEPWTRDGSIPHGCPWLCICRGTGIWLLMEEGEEVQPQLYADNLKCVSGNPDSLSNAARFTTGYVRLVGQETAPSKCAFLSTSREVWKDMKEGSGTGGRLVVCQV